MSNSSPEHSHFDVSETETVKGLRARVMSSSRIVAFTGAGISTESGIPDYRGPGGVWERQAPPTIGDFLENESTRRAFWAARRLRYPEMLTKLPNSGHLALAALERSGRLECVVTQNIDGLHQAAGNSPENVFELHGSTHLIRCVDCGTEWSGKAIQARLEAGEEIPACENCGGILRTGTVLFGEPLPRLALDRAMGAARLCDLMLVVGSSLIVNPAAQIPLIAKRSGATVAIINRLPTPMDRYADIHVLGEAGPTLVAVTDGLSASPGGLVAGDS
jgi:NAD-dependent deacetylase